VGVRVFCAIFGPRLVLSAAAMFVLWIGTQALLLTSGAADVVNVAVWAHLGGAAVGAGAWAWTRFGGRHQVRQG